MTKVETVTNIVSLTPTSASFIVVATPAISATYMNLREGILPRLDSSKSDLEVRANDEITLGTQRRSNPPATDGSDVPYELRAISQPGIFDAPLPALSELDYVYRQEAGEGTWVYVVDSGVWADHDVSSNSQIVLPHRGLSTYSQLCY